MSLEGTCLPNHYSKERERYNMNIFSDAIEQLGIFTIVGGILAIVATVLAYVFIVPENAAKSSMLSASSSTIPAISST